MKEKQNIQDYGITEIHSYWTDLHVWINGFRMKLVNVGVAIYPNPHKDHPNYNPPPAPGPSMEATR